MATIVRDLNGVTTGVFGLGTSQTVAFTGTSAQSTAVGTTTRIVRLVATQPCFFAVGSNPTATTSGVYLPAGAVQYVSIIGGHKVAAIQASAAGSLYVTEAV